MKKYKIEILLSLAVSTILLGCGGSSSTANSPTTKTSTSGKVIDDYIKGATVCADVNDNGKADDGVENCVTTNDNGDFNFGRVMDDALVVTGGINIGTNQEFRGVFLAPAHSKVMNTLTTLIRSIEKTGKSVSEAQSIVKEKLGLPDVDLTTFDSFSEVVYGGSVADREVAKTVLAQQSKIQVLLTVVATTIALGSENVEERDVTEQVADEIVALILDTNTQLVDVASEASVGAIMDATVNRVLVDDVEAIAQVQAVKSIVAKQIESTVVALVSNVEAISVDSVESGLNAIEEVNSALFLITNQEDTDSLVNLIEEAVNSGETDLLADLDVTTKIDELQEELPLRPAVPENVLPSEPLDDSTN